MAERHKAAADKAAMDMTRMAADMSTAHEALLREREALNDLQDQHEQLLRAQEVLQAELSMALGSYQPKATIDSGARAARRATCWLRPRQGGLSTPGSATRGAPAAAARARPPPPLPTDRLRIASFETLRPPSNAQARPRTSCWR